MPIRLLPQSPGVRALGGVADAMEQGGQAWLRQNLAGLADKRITERELFKDYTDKVMAGQLEPEQAEAALTARGMKVPKGYFSSLQPSIESGLEKIVGGMNKADTFQAVPGKSALASEGAVRRSPLRMKAFESPSVPFEGDVPTPEIPQPEGTDTNETPDMTLGSTQFRQTNPAFDNLMGIREEKLNSFPPKEVGTVDANGVKQTRFVSARPDLLTGQSFQAEPTGAQKGRQASNEQLSEAIGNREGNLGGIRGDIFTQQSNAERGARAADTTSTTTAQRTAAQPFDEAQAKFTHNLSMEIPTLGTTSEPNTGQETAAWFYKDGRVVPIAMPEGQSYGKAKAIPPTIADNTAGANTAEIEGVKILRALKATGLDKSNDPIDPRFNKFLINTLKVEPNDKNMQDIQQRTGFVNANLTRVLMGSRPSQYVAKEIIQPHLPQQAMTGALLARTMENVLQQVAERRQEFAHTLGVPVQRLAPQGDSYENWRREQGTPSTRPPQLTLDENGNLVPVRKPQ